MRYIGKREYFTESQEYLKWAVVEREKEIALLKKQLADIQPVRHGRWIIEDDFKTVEQRLRCSKCGWWTINLFVDGSYNYCPKCGAKMDDKDINVPTKSGIEEEDDG